MTVEELPAYLSGAFWFGAPVGFLAGALFGKWIMTLAQRARDRDFGRQTVWQQCAMQRSAFDLHDLGILHGEIPDKWSEHELDALRALGPQPLRINRINENHPR